MVKLKMKISLIGNEYSEPKKNILLKNTEQDINR